MPSATSVTAGVVLDVVLTAGIVVAAFVLAVLLVAMRRLLTERMARPYLPAADRPPAGLGRLIPVGAQVEAESRRGVDALEHWLLSTRKGGTGGA